MGEQRLRQTGALLTGAGVALLAGMVVVALTIPVGGYAGVQVWVAVAAVAAGPLWAGLVLVSSTEHTAPRRLAFSAGVSVVLASVAGMYVRDRYVTHPETPVTASTVAYCVIAVLSVVLTVLALRAVDPRVDLEELRTRSVDVSGLRRWGVVCAVLGALFVVGLVVTSLLAPVPGTGLGVLTACCAVAAAVLLTRMTDLRAAHRSRLAMGGLLLIAMVALVLVWPLAYVLFTTSAVVGILYALQLFAALVVVGVCIVRLTRFLAQHGVAPSSHHRPVAR